MIPYVIDNTYRKFFIRKINFKLSYNDLEQPHKEIILNALKYLMEKTKVNGKDCIKLVPRSNQVDYVNIVNKQGCWSNVLIINRNI